MRKEDGGQTTDDGGRRASDKSEARNPKFETNPKSKIQLLKTTFLECPVRVA